MIEETKGKIILSLVDVKNIASMKAHQKMGFKEVERINDTYQEKKGEEQASLRLGN